MSRRIAREMEGAVSDIEGGGVGYWHAGIKRERLCEKSVFIALNAKMLGEKDSSGSLGQSCV